MNQQYTIEPPPGMIHCANSSALTELQARQEYFKFYQEQIPLEDIVVLDNPKLKGSWAICVPAYWKQATDRAEAQVKTLLEQFAKRLGEDPPSW